VPSYTPPRHLPERTIARSVLVNGQGLHSGARTGLILQPLPAGSGVVFGSILSGETVPALIDHVNSTGYATTLVRGGMVAQTVEHLLATLHAYGITNLLVKMQAEVPVLDGSALELCALLDEGGLVDQESTVEELVVDQRYSVGSDNPEEKGISIEPADRFEVHYKLDYPAPIGRQEFEFCWSDVDAFRRRPPAHLRLRQGNRSARADGPRQRRSAQQLHPGRRRGCGERPAALPRRVRAPQDPRHLRRLLSARPADPRPHHGAQDGAFGQRRVAAHPARPLRVADVDGRVTPRP
jgi:hypothetical protein